METKVFHSGTVGLYEPHQPLGLTRVVVPMWGYTAVEYFGNSSMWTNPVGESQSEICENVEDNTSTQEVSDIVKVMEFESNSSPQSKLHCSEVNDDFLIIA